MEIQDGDYFDDYFLDLDADKSKHIQSIIYFRSKSLYRSLLCLMRFAKTRKIYLLQNLHKQRVSEKHLHKSLLRCGFKRLLQNAPFHKFCAAVYWRNQRLVGIVFGAWSRYIQHQIFKKKSIIKASIYFSKYSLRIYFKKMCVNAMRRMVTSNKYTLYNEYYKLVTSKRVTQILVSNVQNNRSIQLNNLGSATKIGNRKRLLHAYEMLKKKLNTRRTIYKKMSVNKRDIILVCIQKLAACVSSRNRYSELCRNAEVIAIYRLCTRGFGKLVFVCCVPFKYMQIWLRKLIFSLEQLKYCLSCLRYKSKIESEIKLFRISFGFRVLRLRITDSLLARKRKCSLRIQSNETLNCRSLLRRWIMRYAGSKYHKNFIQIAIRQLQGSVIARKFAKWKNWLDHRKW